jgi:quinol monooxygenase YgiN
MKMIVIKGSIKLAPGELEKFRAIATAMAEATRKEKGCVEYAFAQDIADPTILRIVEEWEDEAALTEHFATPHMATFNAAIRDAKVEHASVKAYRAEFVRNMTGNRAREA